MKLFDSIRTVSGKIFFLYKAKESKTAGMAYLKSLNVHMEEWAVNLIRKHTLALPFATIVKKNVIAEKSIPADLLSMHKAGNRQAIETVCFQFPV